MDQFICNLKTLFTHRIGFTLYLWRYNVIMKCTAETKLTKWTISLIFSIQMEKTTTRQNWQYANACPSTNQSIPSTGRHRWQDLYTVFICSACKLDMKPKLTGWNVYNVKKTWNLGLASLQTLRWENALTLPGRNVWKCWKLIPSLINAYANKSQKIYNCAVYN